MLFLSLCQFSFICVHCGWILCRVSNTRTRVQVKSGLKPAVWLWAISSASISWTCKKPTYTGPNRTVSISVSFFYDLTVVSSQKALKRWHSSSWHACTLFSDMLKIHYLDENLPAGQTCTECGFSSLVSDQSHNCVKIYVCHAGCEWF